MGEAYVHGYHPRENRRLRDQAGAQVDLLHGDTAYPAGSRILEAGCGVGAQTVTLARRSPHARLLEHLARPVEALRGLAGLLRPGGSATVVEGDHGSADFHPRSAAADAAIGCQVELQRVAGGDALIAGPTWSTASRAGPSLR